jgi:hypothetical protein
MGQSLGFSHVVSSDVEGNLSQHTHTQDEVTMTICQSEGSMGDTCTRDRMIFAFDMGFNKADCRGFGVTNCCAYTLNISINVLSPPPSTKALLLS